MGIFYFLAYLLVMAVSIILSVVTVDALGEEDEDGEIKTACVIASVFWPLGLPLLLTAFAVLLSVTCATWISRKMKVSK